jgi:hypothetical protein
VPQDRFYGLLGLFAQEQELAAGDYNVSMEMLFWSVTAVIVKGELQELGMRRLVDVAMTVGDNFGLRRTMRDVEVRKWVGQTSRGGRRRHF